ncbi:MAG: tRNA epoxyqueuosine(34) reductase QueG [Armatimonadetes bacterium]|nr:tRNA epoxyqueuosine(34) reductase QueG [Armatimonadota bacterium]
MNTPANNALAVKQYAADAGFDAARITTPDAPAHTTHTKAWLDAGMNAEMGWLETRAELRGGRADDERLLAGARSVVVLAASYASRESASQEAGARGTVARYARAAEDYHTVIREMLNALAGRIEAGFPGAKCRGFVDSGPLRERELAARAGIGWQGKHTNLISLDLGNFFFLAALLTTLELAPDTDPAANHCGTCTRCLAACPTGALIAPMTLDARRCVSYLTIEHRGAIALHLREGIGDKVFGCDDCLAACPWNERARAGQNARLAAQPNAGRPDLLQLLSDTATEEGFRARFRGTPLLRPKREGMRRNACIALGNVGGTDALALLQTVVETDPSEVVRESATWAIAKIAAR